MINRTGELISRADKPGRVDGFLNCCCFTSSFKYNSDAPILRVEFPLVIVCTYLNSNLFKDMIYVIFLLCILRQNSPA